MGTRWRWTALRGCGLSSVTPSRSAARSRSQDWRRGQAILPGSLTNLVTEEPYFGVIFKVFWSALGKAKWVSRDRVAAATVPEGYDPADWRALTALYIAADPKCRKVPLLPGLGVLAGSLASAATPQAVEVEKHALSNIATYTHNVTPGPRSP